MTETEKTPPILLPTSKGRTMRLLNLIQFLKEKKKVPVEEALKYIMSNWLISTRVAKTYLKDLEVVGMISIETEGLKEYVVYKEG
jgi:predicted transcriptional regulator